MPSGQQSGPGNVLFPRRYWPSRCLLPATLESWQMVPQGLIPGVPSFPSRISSPSTSSLATCTPDDKSDRHPCLGQRPSEVPLSWHSCYESVPSLSEVSQFGPTVLWSAHRGRTRGYRQRNSATCRGSPGFESDHHPGRPTSWPLTGRVFLTRLGPLPWLSPQSPAPWGCCVGIGHSPHPPIPGAHKTSLPPNPVPAQEAQSQLPRWRAVGCRHVLGDDLHSV